MKKFLEYKYTFWLILLAAFCLRLIPALCAIQDDSRLLRPDSSGYLEPARAMAESAIYPTTRRPPGYPIFAAAVYAVGGNNTILALLQVAVAVATCAVTAMAAKAYAGKAAGNLAALFMALNLTAIANTPLLLSDTLFALFAAGEFFFFIRYYKSSALRDILICAIIAATATLIRPINQLFFVVLVFMIMTMPGKVFWKTRLLHSALVLLTFAVILMPWMYRNYSAGATFDIDTNTGAMRHQNGAMLMAKVNGTEFESEKRKLMEIEKKTFSDTEAFPDERSKEKWRKAEFRKMVMQYPATYIIQHFDIRVLLPDAPTLLECFGTTSSDRGTMGVLKKDGLFAAIKHYFGEKWLLMLLFMLPLLLPVMLLYLAAFLKVGKDLLQIKKNYYELLIFLAFAEYYLFLPGSITAPRYQLPALPCLCTLAAYTILTMLHHCDENTERPQKSAEV